MLAFRPMYTFRERAPEWVLSWGLIIIGITFSAYPEVFARAGYIPLLSIMSPKAWVGWITSIGLIRIISLTVNGAWRPTPHIRVFGSIAGLTIWSSLLCASLLEPFIDATNLSTFGMLLSFELMALWWAAGDAKLVDILAKRKKQVANGSN